MYVSCLASRAVHSPAGLQGQLVQQLLNRRLLVCQRDAAGLLQLSGVQQHLLNSQDGQQRVCGGAIPDKATAAAAMLLFVCQGSSGITWAACVRPTKLLRMRWCWLAVQQVTLFVW